MDINIGSGGITCGAEKQGRGKHCFLMGEGLPGGNALYGMRNSRLPFLAVTRMISPASIPRSSASFSAT